MPKTTLINDTTHVVKVKQGNAGVFSKVAVLHPGKTFTLHGDLNVTYREYDCTDEANKTLFPGSPLSSNDTREWAAITFYMTPLNDSVSWRGTKPRENISLPQDKAAYKALESDASGRIKTVASLCASLEMHLKHIKICHAQCEHLVQTLSKGIQKMIKIYTNVSQDDTALWILYQSRKLRKLVISLDILVISLRSAENLLLKCGSNWRKMALVVSVPLRPGMKTCSEFDLLMGELRWKLAMIEYLLYLGNESDVQWKWCTRTCRFELLVKNLETNGGGAEDDTCSRVNSDRDNLIHRLEDESIFAWAKLNCLWPSKYSSQFARDGAREDFATVLKQRLTIETFVSSSLAPISFEINHLDLKCREKLSSGAAKKIYRGEWLGQEVAIAIMGSPFAEIPDLENLVKKEAGFLMKLQHPNIVACYGYSYTHNAPLPASKHGATAAGYLVLELMEEDLGRTIEKHMNLRGPFLISVALDILLQIVEAMVHSHEYNVMHRDLKPGNCLVKSRSLPSSNPQALDVYYDVKLTNFGSARMVDPGDAKSKKTANPGTTRWMAPEMVCPPGNWIAEYRKSADVYGFAMICYQVITGIVPYADEVKNTSTSDVIQAVSEGKLRPTFPLSLSCPEGLKQVMRDCWHHEADSRPDFKEIQRRLWSVRKDEELAGIRSRAVWKSSWQGRRSVWFRLRIWKCGLECLGSYRWQEVSDGGQEQVNGVRMAQGLAQARGSSTMAASPGVQGPSQRPQSGGLGPGPGPTKAGGGGQFNGFGDVGQLRTSMMLNSGSGSGSGAQMSSSGTNVQSVGNGRPAFSGGSLHGGGSGQGQIQAASSLAMTGAAVVPSGPAAVLGPQATTSVVQQ